MNLVLSGKRFSFRRATQSHSGTFGTDKMRGAAGLRWLALAARAWIPILMLSVSIASSNFEVLAQNPPQQPGPRRPLPKPPAGSRGFEQAGRDASSRLIAAGATRGPLKPIAPFEGLAYGTHPFFSWAPAPGAGSYHFILRAGAESAAPIVYESEVNASELTYPDNAPDLTPGDLYSWRISTAGVLERKLGPVATFFVLTDEDRNQVKQALSGANLTSPQNPLGRLAQAKVFKQYGVWYDAFGIATKLIHEDPTNNAAKMFYDSLIQQLREETARAASQSASLALLTWRELEPLVAAGNEAGARAAILRNPIGARALYRNLLFEAVASRLHANPSLKSSEQLRKLLANVDPNGDLETKFNEWSKERKLGIGFTNAGDGIEQILYLAQVAEMRGAGGDPGKDAPQGSARELTERALELSETNGIELAVAGLSGTLAVYALREKQVEDFNAPLDRAEQIWIRWNHSLGLFQAPLLRGYAAQAAENWEAAAAYFLRAAELALGSPELRPPRIQALSLRANALRNAGEKEGVRAALRLAVDEQQLVVKETSGEEAHLNDSKLLADLETQFGGSMAALGRHVEAGEWYARAESLQGENYEVERRLIEKNIADTTAAFQARMAESKSADFRQSLAQTLETYADTRLSYLDSLASSRSDLVEIARIADVRLALARRSGESEKIAYGLTQAANAYRKAGDLEKAKKAADEALALRSSDPRHRWIYETLYLLAQIADDGDDWDKALALYRQVIVQTEPGGLPPIYDLTIETNPDIRPIKAKMNNFDLVARASKALDARTGIGVIMARKGNYREADQEYQAVLTDAPRLYAIGAPDEAELLNWLRARGNAEVKSVDIAAYRRQTGFSPDAAEERRLDLAAIAVNSHRATVTSYRANLYESENDLENAIKAYERANALITSLTGGSFSLSGTYVALARIERERGNYAAAEAPIEAALAEFVRKNEAWGIANMLVFKSALRRDQGRLAESRQLAEDALKIARPLSSRSQVAGILRTLGRTESEQGREALNSSEQHLREALTIWREMGLRAHTAYSLDSLGQTLERRGRDDQALAAYIEAVGIVETLVSSLSADVSSETFNASRGNRDLYDHLINLLIKKGRAAEALQYLERAKSKSLVDALAGANVNVADPALKALIDHVRTSGDSVREAETALATELQKPAKLHDNTKIASLRKQLESAQKHYVNAVSEIKRANPSYASLVAVNPTDLIEVRKHLPEKTLLLEYFPTDTELYIFVVTRTEGPAIRTIAIKRADLTQLVLQYREALSGATEQSALDRSMHGLLWKDDGTQDFKTHIAPIKDATARLYDLLLAPVQAEIDISDTIVIVPAGELYYLPFHALGRLNQDGSLSFLIQSKSFAYLASADLLNAISPATNAAKTARAGAGSGLLALGNPDGSLPAASIEVSELGRLFTGANVYTGKAATVAKVATTVAKAAYLHFATHGFINSLEPKESYLLLAGQPDRLSVKDLVEDNYELSLAGIRLVTLSACDTNIGGFDPSAVYSSLSRAFSKAGAPTVVASLWSVNDVSTLDTMTNFYKELAAGQPKGEAMRRAQLATMSDPRFAHPYFWAPFVILGDWR
jgi:CHAT domain-containing protein